MGSEAHTEPEISQHVGLIPRFITDFFLWMQRKKEASDKGDKEGSQVLLDFILQASFLEVYGEDIHDLLDKNRESLPMREDSSGGVVVKGLKTRPISNTSEALQVLHDGTMNRTTAATLMNLTSSRSHAIFTIYLSQVTRSHGSGTVDVTTTSRFTFVDLAGSERMKKTGAEGERAREGIKINEGLLALGNVINALGDEERIAKEKKIHVPYRQSKLTRLLREALGGNSQTLFLACVSPSDTNASETLSTLNYANRARNIRNVPTRNVDANMAELQRLHTINRVLQSELIKSRFQIMDCAEDNTIGKIDEAVLKRDDVEKYIQEIYEAARTMLSPEKPVSSPLSLLNLHPEPFNQRNTEMMIVQKASLSGTVSSAVVETESSDPKLHTRASEKFDDGILDEMNPDAELAILDQLLELQQNDHDYEKEKKHDDAKLKEMDGELEKGEAMLLQLRESLKVYHSLKARYEELMAEVQQLETEKASLAKQLEGATADPSQGCSAAIKRKLESVEMNLSRARRETLTHRQKYRQAEDQARKCQVLERKVNELKHSKVSLLRKQKEAAIKYRETADAKTKELLALKRKGKATDKKVSKLENEVNIHKNTLNKRKRYCDKLTEKLRQTEDHLVKLLATRQKDLSRRTSIVPSFGRNSSMLGGSRKQSGFKSAMDTHALSDEDLKATRYVFDSMVLDKVKQNRLQKKYSDLVTTYGETMRKVVLEVKSLEELRRRLGQKDSMASMGKIRDKEEVIADLELKIELLDAELQEISSQLPNDSPTSDQNVSEAVSKLMSAMSAPALRNLLMETFSKFVEAESERQALEESVLRKDAALLSFETEVDSLNYKINSLSTDLADRKVFDESGKDQFEIVRDGLANKRQLEEALRSKDKIVEESKSKVRDLETALQSLQNELSSAKENLAVANVSLDQMDRRIDAEQSVQRLQVVWKELGVDPGVREESRAKIARCLEDTCARELETALSLKTASEKEIASLSDQMKIMRRALGAPFDYDENSSGDSTILGSLSSLRQQYDMLENPFQFASARREKIIKDAASLSIALDIAVETLPMDLQVLLEGSTGTFNDVSAPTGASGLDANTKAGTMTAWPPNCLEPRFLTLCEGHIANLRVKKSELLVNTRERQQSIAAVVQTMHLSHTEALEIVEGWIRQCNSSIPSWWDSNIAEDILRDIAQSKFLSSPTVAIAQHLAILGDALEESASCRKKVSEKLKSAIETAQRTLLDIVGRELDASEAYTGFQDALFRLPALSKDLILSCVSELEALIDGIEAMTRSEIEALTVVWEALKAPAEDRSDFWGMLEKTDALVSRSDSKNSLMMEKGKMISSSEVWMDSAIRRSSEVHQKMEPKLAKLSEIHQEVERLRSKQDTKSQILSLDAEIRVMNAKLVDFEDFQCDKQRLLTKKNGGSALLKEERFRKQMQAKFASNLEQLANLLRAWEKRENTPFDASALSEDVRMLLNEPEKMEEWVEKRTKFMSLRTVKMQSPAPKNVAVAASKHPATRQPEKAGSRNLSSLTPPRKRKAQSQTNPLTFRDDNRAKPPIVAASKKGVASRPVSLPSQKRNKNDGPPHPGPDVLDNGSDARPIAPAPKRLKKTHSSSAPLLPFGSILTSPKSKDPADN